MNPVEQAPDVITTAVVQNGLVAAAKEMSITLERAAYNPLLFELKDYSAVITDAEGALWAEAPGLIAFITPLPALIRHGVSKFGPDGLEPGDVVIARLVRVKLTIAGDRVIADFTGSSPRTAGPINLPFQASRGAVNAALKSVLAPLAPANEGELRVLDVIAPEDSVINPKPPAPCDSYGYVFHAVLESSLEALSQVAPDRCPAGSGNVFGCFIFRLDPSFGDPFIMIDATTVGWGGRPTGDGPNLIFLLDGDTPNVPGEVIETRYPLRMTRHAWKTDVIGHGKYRGGPGLTREFEMLGDRMYAQAAMENRHSPPAGVAGGRDAIPQRIVVWADSDAQQVFEERFAFVGPLDRGQRLRTEAGGGGGWGPPGERDPERVLDDVRNELVTVEVAREVYRVAIEARGDDYELDGAATERLRAEAAEAAEA